MIYQDYLSMEAANELLENLHQTQQDILFSRSNNLNISNQTLLPILENSCRDISRLMACERVEIWLFNKDKTQLKLETFYDSRNNSKRDIDKIPKEEAPAYFQSIIDQRILAVDDLSISETVPKLYRQDSYQYHNLSSMLDTTIILNWGVGGVVCCLSEKVRQWTPTEKYVVASVADMIGFIYDGVYRTKMEKHLYRLAYKDTLTNLNNQHSFEKKVNEQMKLLSTSKKGIFLYIILDQFSDIQGALGHEAGEQVLKIVARRLEKLFPDPAIIARIGFDHFIIFSPILADEKQIAEGFPDVTNLMNDPMDVLGQEVYITFSFGVSYFPEYVRNAKDGLQSARIALMNARQKDMRQAEGIYQLDMQSFIQENLSLEVNFRRALDNKQFELFYQPQVSAKSGEVHGFEALIRWNHPERGVISPAYFIPLAESTGLIISIGERVIREAFAQLSRWQAAGYGHYTISVNLSPRHFLHEELMNFLKTCAKESGVSPNRLILEITEDVDFENHKKAQKRISDLNKAGFSVSIDDFGTGYSAFVYLQHLPVQEIKIDQRFIRNIDSDSKGAEIVKIIIQLGKMLNLKIVSEGVETLAEWNTLKEIGCDYIQGFYFSKPLPIGDINSLIQSVSTDENLYLPIPNK